MTGYVTEVPLRWSDLDTFNHVNNARLLTLLEEARIEMLFFASQRYPGAQNLAGGVVIARLSVDYKQPLRYEGQSARVEIGIDAISRRSFTLNYRLRSGPSAQDPVAATAETVQVAIDSGTQQSRALTEPEREFLHTYELDDRIAVAAARGSG